MTTLYIKQNQLALAGEILRQGGCVAFPTETVYGLGANALDAQAVARIFEAKGRPSDNPLIVHIAEKSMLEMLVSTPSEVAERLMEEFWPGPLTLVLPKKDTVPDIVTAGLATVAVRIPNHDWALEILQESGLPIAAPSANRSGSPSGTTWETVRDDLDGLIDGIVCGPPTEIGLESTVLDVSGEVPRILRPGKVSCSDLRKIVPNVINFAPKSVIPKEVVSTFNSPGLRHRHYQPKAKVVLVEWNDSSDCNHSSANFASSGDFASSLKTWYIGTQEPPAHLVIDRKMIVNSIDEYANRLFLYFREADEASVQMVFCEQVSESELGSALMDRLRRAAESE